MSAEQPVERSTLENSPKAQPSRSEADSQLSATPTIAVPFALLGGALAWIIFLVMYPVFAMPVDMQAGREITADQDKAIGAAISKANRQNTFFALAVVGALIGGSLGLAEGVARRSVTVAIMGAVLIAVIGGVAGIGGGLLSDLTYERLSASGDPIEIGGTILMQAIALTVLGGCIGLGLSLSTGRVRAMGNCLVAGLVAGIGAGLLYPIVLAFVLPGAQTQVLVPISAGSQLIWIAVIAGLLSLIISGTAAKRPVSPIAAAEPR